MQGCYSHRPGVVESMSKRRLVSACPGEQSLAKWAADGEDHAVAAHVDECPACAALLHDVGVIYGPDDHEESQPTGFVRHDDLLDQGTLTPDGRYEIGYELARGGMGVVFRAHDLRLERWVALKIVTDPDPSMLERFSREMALTAMLEHPGIAPIYDAGHLADGRPYYVMRLVHGRRLDRVLAEGPNTGERLVHLPLLLRVAEAVAHAHQRGVIHRDLKPHNVVVEDAGSVVVLDWGLAKHHQNPDIRGPTKVDEASGVTHQGQILGTPGYMAPEQARGEKTDARSDVYSLGIMLRLVLSERPSEELDPEHPASPGTPPELRAIERCATALAPDRRYRDAGEVARELRRFMSGQLVKAHRYTLRERFSRALHVHRTKALVSLVSSALVAATIFGARTWLEHERRVEQRTALRAHDQACEEAAAEIDDVWHAGAARELARHLADSPSYVAQSFQKVSNRLDLHTRRWKQLRREACRRGARDESWDTQLQQASEACFESQTMRIASLLDHAKTAEPKTRHLSFEAVWSLPAPEECIDLIALERWKAGEESERARSLLRRADALLATHELDEAQRALDEAASLGTSDSFRARAAIVRHGIEHSRGNVEASVSSLEEAFEAAVAGGSTTLGFIAATTLLNTHAATTDEIGLARSWGRIADGFRRKLELDHEENSDHPLLANYWSGLALLHTDEGQYQEAIQEQRRSIAILETGYGSDHPRLASATANLASLHEIRGELELAEQLYRRAIEIHEAAWGDAHPEQAYFHLGLGNVYLARADFDAAQDSFEQAGTLTQPLGEDHPSFMSSLEGAAVVSMRRGRYDEAADTLERVLELQRSVFGPTNPRYADTLERIGLVALGREAYAEASRVLEEVLALREEVYGPDHPLTGNALLNLGIAVRLQGALDDAESHFRRALAIYSDRVGPQSQDVATASANLSDVLVARKQFDAARSLLERALKIYEDIGAAAEAATVRYGLADVLLEQGEIGKAQRLASEALSERQRLGLSPADVAEVRFVLARAAQSAGERREAKALAVQARSEAEERSSLVERIDAWLRRHHPRAKL